MEIGESWKKFGEVWRNWKLLEEIGRSWRWEPNDFLNGFMDGSGSKKRWGREKQWMEAWER